MATPMSADQFVKALKAEGVKVAEHSGWRTHNRNHKGAWGPMNGVVIHHTAGANSLSLCYNGTADLPGPLCHTHLSKAGTATMVGNGRANHAGTFASNAFNAMLNESSTHPRPSSSEPIDANSRTYGIEIENLGNGKDPYPAKQYDQAVRWAAAICRYHGWTANSVIGHKEGTTRKIDPSFSMSDFRADVKERLAHKANWTYSEPADEPQEDPDVPNTLGLTSSSNVTLSPSVWKTLTIGSSQDLLTGAKAYQVTAYVRLESGPYGCTVQGRFYHLRPDGTRWESPIMERETTAGSTFADFTHSGSIMTDEKLRFEAVYFPVDPADPMARDITSVQARGLYWA